MNSEIGSEVFPKMLSGFLGVTLATNVRYFSFLDSPLIILITESREK